MIFLEFSLSLSFFFSMIQWMLEIWSLVLLPFLNPACTSGSSRYMYCWSIAWRIVSITLLACKMSTIVQWFEHSLTLIFFGIGMKTDLFQSYGHCWVFQICWHFECKFGLGVQNEAGPRLIDFCQENALVIANTLFQQRKRRLYTWTSPDSQHQNQIDYILCSQRWRSSLQSEKTKLGADCGSDHDLLIAKYRLKLKKAGKTTRPFRYDLNQNPYDYTVEVRNRLKGLIEYLVNYGPRFVTLYRK